MKNLAARLTALESSLLRSPDPAPLYPRDQQQAAARDPQAMELVCEFDELRIAESDGFATPENLARQDEICVILDSRNLQDDAR